MRRIKSFVPVATLKTVYKGLVLPYFENFSPLWANCGKLLKDKLQRFKSRATRVLKGATYDIRSAGLIDSLSWQTLDDRRRCAKSILMYTIIYRFRVRFFKKIQIRILESKNGFCVSLIKSENGF